LVQWNAVSTNHRRDAEARSNFWQWLGIPNALILLCRRPDRGHGPHDGYAGGIRWPCEQPQPRRGHDHATRAGDHPQARIDISHQAPADSGERPQRPKWRSSSNASPSLTRTRPSTASAWSGMVRPRSLMTVPASAGPRRPGSRSLRPSRTMPRPTGQQISPTAARALLSAHRLGGPRPSGLLPGRAVTSTAAGGRSSLQPRPSGR
jgi:hypothetical protein